jgi:hypothetical protein
MIKKVEDVEKWLRLNESKYFSVRIKNGDNYQVFESDEQRPFEENISLFKSVMELSKGGGYTIIAKDTKNSKRGNFFEEFNNLDSEQNIQTSSSIRGITEEEVDRRAKKMFEDYKYLEKEANRKNSVTEQFLERLTPYVGTIVPLILNKFGSPGTIAIQGIEDEKNSIQEAYTEEITLDENKTDRLEKALQKWGKADPEFVEYIEAFAEFASSGKKVMGMDYKQIKMMFGPDKLTNMLN